MLLSMLCILLFIAPLFKQQQTIVYHFSIEKQSPGFKLYSPFLSAEKICLGKPYQCIPVQFDPATSILVIQGNNNNNLLAPANYFNKSQSSKYYSNKCYHDSFSCQKMIDGYLSFERMKFGPLQMTNTTFFLIKTCVSELKYSSIGLSAFINDEVFPNLINKLGQVEMIRNNTFLIECNYHTLTGRVIIGDYAPYITAPKLFTLRYRIYYVAMYYRVQGLLFDGDPLGTEYLLFDTVFDETFRFVQMPSKVKQAVYDYYLNETACEEVIYVPNLREEKDVSYMYYLCPKRKYVNTNRRYDNITFKYKEGDVVLHYEDLFDEYNKDKMIFNIVFRLDKAEPGWIIGHPILKHYLLSRDLDNNTVTFYDLETQYKPSLNLNSNSLRYYLLIIISTIMSISTILIGIAYVMINKNK